MLQHFFQIVNKIKNGKGRAREALFQFSLFFKRYNTISYNQRFIIKSFLVFSEFVCSLQIPAQCACSPQDWISVSVPFHSGLLSYWKPAQQDPSQHFHSPPWISAGLYCALIPQPKGRASLPVQQTDSLCR